MGEVDFSPCPENGAPEFNSAFLGIQSKHFVVIDLQENVVEEKQKLETAELNNGTEKHLFRRTDDVPGTKETACTEKKTNIYFELLPTQSRPAPRRNLRALIDKIETPHDSCLCCRTRRVRG